MSDFLILTSANTLSGFVGAWDLVGEGGRSRNRQEGGRSRSRQEGGRSEQERDRGRSRRRSRRLILIK